MGLETKLSLKVASTLTSPLDLASGRVALDYSKIISLASGVTGGQADTIFHDQRTLAGSATENLDLAASLVDAFGTPITLARVKGLIVAAAAGNTNDVLVGGASPNAWATWVGDATDVVRLRPGALFAQLAGAADATGYAVTAATGDLLKVANSGAGTSVTYDVIIIGSSA